MADTLRQTIRIDLVVFDKRGQPVLMVEVKAMAGARNIARPWLMLLAAEFCSTGFPIRYWMLVDLDEILIFNGEVSQPSSPIFSMKTADVLGVYDSDFEVKRIFDDYLLALVETWLRDFTFDWRSANPPGMKQLAEIGLTERLKGGTTHREVSFVDHEPLLGNQLRDEPFPGTRLGDG